VRRTLLNLHLCIGVAACAFLTVLSLTGAIIAFENELNRVVNPQLLKVHPHGQALPWELVRRRVEEATPAWRVQRIYMPASAEDSTYVRLVSRASGSTDEIYVDQYTGRVLGRKQLANPLIWKIHELHINLAAANTGSEFVVWSCAGLLCLALTGLYLWWPRKVFRFRTRAPFARANYDLHRSLGFWSSAVMLLFAVTGLNLHIQTGGTLFQMMDAKATTVHVPGHGTSVDELLQTAREMAPGAEAMRISFWNDQRPVLVQLRFPEDHTPAGRTNVTLDQHTGAVLSVVSSRTAPIVYTALVQWNRELHTGTILGWPSRVLMSFYSLLLSLLAATGPIIWANKKMAAIRGRRLAAERLRVRMTAEQVPANEEH